MTTPPTETLPGSQISAAPEMTAAAALNDYAERIPRSRIILSSMIGTTIEFYDFYVYATAAVAVFPALFFPKADATAALLSSFATFGLAFIARPLGSLIFGHFGDRVGRKATLVASLLTMGIATFLIGLLPTYVQAGVWAPAMLSILRFCQGLGLGGEWSGAVLLATETAPKGKRGWAGMWPQLGAPLGFLLANGLFLILVHALNHTEGALDGDFMVWGWRIPFLLSIVMVILGLYVRMKLEETPVFQHAVTHGKRVASPHQGNISHCLAAPHSLHFHHGGYLRHFLHHHHVDALLRDRQTRQWWTGNTLRGIPPTAAYWDSLFHCGSTLIQLAIRQIWASETITHYHDDHCSLRLYFRRMDSRHSNQRGRSKLADSGHVPHGAQLRPHVRPPARTIPHERALYRLRHCLQCGLNSWRRPHPIRCHLAR